MRSSTIIHYLCRTAIVLILAGIISTLFVTVSFCIPEHRVSENRERSEKILKELEPGYKNWELLFTHGWNGYIDTETDYLIIEHTRSDPDRPPLKNAMSHYPRYWEGGSAYLRIMFLVFSYAQVRYLLMAVITLLICAVSLKTAERVGKGISFAFVISLIAGNYILIPFTMQVSNCFVIALSAMLWVLCRYRGRQTDFLKLYTGFMITGAVLAFFDLLTVPVLTIGMPLCVLILLNLLEYKITDIKTNMKYIAGLSASWLIGYGGLWVQKWLIGSVVLGKNVFSDALNQVVYRTGNTHVEFNRFYTIALNLKAILPTQGENLFRIMFFITVSVVAAVIILLMRRPDFSDLRMFLPLLLTGLYPIIWYLAVADHSEVHASILSWRLLMIPVFILCSVYAYYFNKGKGVTRAK
ncbi:MAG: hypothetical protein K6F86_09910 [Lachnospiraceae bacterium]|nr:hypothetical protein [Lachnospiraceae bacterium]